MKSTKKKEKALKTNTELELMIRRLKCSAMECVMSITYFKLLCKRWTDRCLIGETAGEYLESLTGRHVVFAVTFHSFLLEKLHNKVSRKMTKPRVLSLGRREGHRTWKQMEEERQVWGLRDELDQGHTDQRDPGHPGDVFTRR